MKNQYLPGSGRDSLEAMLERETQSQSPQPRAKVIGPKNRLDRDRLNLAFIGAVGECSRPRAALPGRLHRWPFKTGVLARIAVGGWNVLSREWRALADLTYRALRSLHTRIAQLENTALAERVADLEARVRVRDSEREGAYLNQQEITVFMERVAERFRGDAGELRQRLGVHVDLVRAATDAVTGKSLLDLGCGHGEWLALMRDAGITAYGVDLAPECVAACDRQGLDAGYGDALQALDDATPDRLAVVTAFHLVEHLPLAGQIALFTKAYAALAPGGLLLLETPNPENLHIIGAGFWYDPTHHRPLPAQLLKVFAEAAGFSRVETRFINPPDLPALEVDHYPPRLRHQLFCGQDTALYAWK